MSVNCFPDLDILDNSLDGIDPREKNKKLKSLNKDIKDGYDKLETLGNKPYDGDNGLEFKDRRVYEFIRKKFYSQILCLSISLARLGTILPVSGELTCIKKVLKYIILESNSECAKGLL
jgi:hypothetical protein